MQDVWSAIQAPLKKRLGAQNYEVWIEPMQLAGTVGNTIRLRVPNRYFRDWVRENFSTDIADELQLRLQARVRVEFQVGDDDPTPTASSHPSNSATNRAATDAATTLDDDAVAAPTTPRTPPVGLRPQPGSSDTATPKPTGTTAATSTGRSTKTKPSRSKASQHHTRQGIARDKTFDNFVVGACNQFAHAAAQAAADSPGESQYNPLFIYGDTGLGKTHLMHAIGNAMQQRDEQVHVLYVTAEQYTNEMIDALRYRCMPDFRDKYRKHPDILLIDDVQFFSGKDRTQEELFHTFEDLYKRGKQIVFTADVLPREIDKFAARLRTRCESGMLADTQPPDPETMVAILRQKAENMGLPMSGELSQWIANRVRGSIRELEGVLNRLKAVCRLHNVTPTIEFARQHLSGILPDAPAAPTSEEIIHTVANFYSLKVSDIKGTRRLKQIVRPRHVAMYLTRELTELSFPEIGRAFGGRDHATVQHACKKIRGLLVKDADLRNTIETVQRMVVR